MRKISSWLIAWLIFHIRLKPVLIGLLFNIPLFFYGLSVSPVQLNDYLEKMPILPIGLFALAIISGVGLAYFTGGRKFYKMDLIDALKQDIQY